MARSMLAGRLRGPGLSAVDKHDFVCGCKYITFLSTCKIKCERRFWISVAIAEAYGGIMIDMAMHLRYADLSKTMSQGHSSSRRDCMDVNLIQSVYENARSQHRDVHCTATAQLKHQCPAFDGAPNAGTTRIIGALSAGSSRARPSDLSLFSSPTDTSSSTHYRLFHTRPISTIR